MGYTTILDILGSIIIGGMLMLILFRLTDAASENTYNYSQDLIVQENLTTVVEVLENDLRKLGYCKDWTKIPTPTQAILLADSTSIKFLTDVNNTGNVDTLSYYLGPTSELTSTPNPNDRLLYRVVDNETPRSANLGITQFSLLYFDSFGDTLTFPITSPGQIASIQISIKIEDPEPRLDVNGHLQYVDAFWRQVRLEARNLKNR